MARIEVPMPQMGESIAEGTVSRWMKQAGDAVDRDEPILEISTDKVDAEIPAPAAGVLVDIQVGEGETVEVGTVVAYIETDASAAAGATTKSEAAAAPETKAAPPPSAPASDPQPVAPAAVAQSPGAPTGSPTGSPAGSADERLRQRSTPVVRKIAAEHGIDLGSVPGTGHAGRVTKADILAFIESGGPAAVAKPAAPPSKPAVSAPAAPSDPSDLWTRFYTQASHPEFTVRDGDRVETMEKIRRLTAEHMVLAKRVAPHVHSFVEIDFTRVDQLRRANKARWQEQGARVSYTAFVAWACAHLLRDFPMVNSTVSGNNVIYRKRINVGIAVDLDPGLIVPVIHDADELSLVGIAKRMVDLAERARSRKLQPAEIQGVTFSLTNPGVLGTLVGLPIIPKGTSAILGTGAIEKKVVVLQADDGSDMMAIRKRALFSLGYDHRIVDGADSARFLSALKRTLEEFPDDV